MGAWLDFSLADFLLFSPGTYWRLFELMNAAVWPRHVVILGMLVGTLLATAWGWRYAGLASALCLAACWALVANLFLATYYQPINWAITWVIPLAWLQAGLLVVLAPGLRFAATSGKPWPWGLVALALAYPVLGLLAGRPLIQVETAGLAPDPTSMLTLGMVGLARPGWRTRALSVLPLGWIALSAATLHAMEMATAWVLVSILGLGVWTLFRRR